MRMSIDRIGTRLLGWAVVIVASHDGQTCRWEIGDSGSHAWAWRGGHERGFIFRLLLDLWLTAMKSTTKDSLATSVDTKTVPFDGDSGKDGCISRSLELVVGTVELL
jgi:hypothetical protein